jgi:hypothetical protein
MEAIKNSKPLNLGKLNNFLTEMNVWVRKNLIDWLIDE